MRADLAALVGSRICHDLISPIGAIGNGVELLSLTDGNTDAEMALISESVESANARIRFFRIAFGAASADQMVSRGDVMAVLSASARGGRFTYFWQVDGDHPRRNVRIAFLVLQCFETAFPLGGDVSVSQADGVWTVAADGARMNVEDALWRSLTDPNTTYAHSPAQVQFALLPGLVSEAGRQLDVQIAADKISVRF